MTQMVSHMTYIWEILVPSVVTEMRSVSCVNVGIDMDVDIDVKAQSLDYRNLQRSVYKCGR